MAKQKKSTFERLSSGMMNRQQRRDLGRRLAGNDPGLTIVHPNAGGIDVGNEPFCSCASGPGPKSGTGIRLLDG
jgi:hypothetical protein